MIRYFLVQNLQGKTRLSKWWVFYEDEEKRQLQYEIFRLVNARESSFTNFVEFRNHKVIYRRYAGLFFCFCVDIEDNDLAHLEAIHLFVKVLDKYFGGDVCELDLIFNFHKIYIIVDEIFLAGEVLESSEQLVLERLAALDKMD